MLRWRSATYTILERHADVHTVFVGMGILNADDQTARKNKRNSIVE